MALDRVGVGIVAEICTQTCSHHLLK